MTATHGKRIDLDASEKYAVMRWVDEHREVCAAREDSQIATCIKEDTGVTVTTNHVAYARRQFGIDKRPQKRVQPVDTLRASVRDLASIVALLAEQTGNHITARQARAIAEGL